MICSRALLPLVVAASTAIAAEQAAVPTPAQAPIAQAQAPTPQTQAPIGQAQAPAAQAQMPIVQGQPPAAASSALGRLFFSPTERAAIDESRRRPAATAVVVQEQKPLPPAPEYVMLNGVVRRSDGSTAVWLNNRLLDGKRTADGLEVSDSRRAPGPANVTVRVPQAGRSVDLRVGQQLDVTSGKVHERYQVAPRNPAPASGEMTGADAPAAAPRSASRRPSREREVRELLRDLEGPPPERVEPQAEPKG